MNIFRHAGFVLGNGVSRLAVDLNQLKMRGKVYGCNALYRSFTPTVLVATDKPISETIQRGNYALNNRFYTRRPISGLGGKQVPHHTFSSGPNAVAVAIEDGCSDVYLIGFDMGPLENSTFNNVYAGTEFYKAEGATQTFTGNWVKQLLYIMEHNPTTVFHRVFGDTTAEIPEFKIMRNLQNLQMEDFVKRINTP